MTEDVYRNLQKHFDQFALGFPATESGIEIRLLKHLFTPDEAEIALHLGHADFGSIKNLESLEDIYERVKHLGYDSEELEKLLDNMARKGAIIGVTEDDIKSYANVFLVLGIYEFQVNKLTEEFLEDFYQYINEAWGPANEKVKTPQMRIIPIGINLDFEKKIENYDNIKTLFEKAEKPFIITNCVCRQSKDLLGDPCKMTNRREVCMGFGDLAKVYIEHGWGREITREEALNYLKKNEQEGLIFQPGNSQDMNFICSCCSCCCGTISSLKRLPNPADYTTSNYYAKIDEALCIGCGSCIERCQMNAITLKDNISRIDLKRCIGCGNCALECPSDAIGLYKKEKHNIPPKNVEELNSIMAKERKAKN
ncbi:MAG: 4Fe-4S dicluster domain-containing protein [Promethearchaeota archaeon]|nr:MAG: 4Fe-4S dicluster domain-containing protein [Candidatus Lokiarchaeota archaeon]